jgi:hypothetical protein
MEQQATNRTIARLPGCVLALAVRSGFLHCLCRTPGAEFSLLRITPHGEVEGLPFGSIPAGWNSAAITPDGRAIFTCHYAGEIWMHSAPWGSGPPVLVLSGQVAACHLDACEEG